MTTTIMTTMRLLLNRRVHLDHTAAQGVTEEMVERFDKAAVAWGLERNSSTPHHSSWKAGYKEYSEAKAALISAIKMPFISNSNGLSTLSTAPPAPVGEAPRCDGQLCYYHGCQHLPGCVHDNKLPRSPSAGEAPAVPVADLLAQARRTVDQYNAYAGRSDPYGIASDCRDDMVEMFEPLLDAITTSPDLEAMRNENAALKARVRELAFRIENIVDIDVAVSDHDKIRFILKAVREAAAALQNEDQPDG